LGPRPQGGAGQPVRIVEKPKLQGHPSARQAQRHVIGGEPQALVDLRHRLHPLAALPEHRSVVAAGVDVGRAAFHRLQQKRLGGGEILVVHRREPFVRQPTSLGQLERHRRMTVHKSTPSRN